MADIGKAPEGFPRRMQAARAVAGLTIEQLAERLKDERGLGPHTLRNIENGSGSAPGAKRRAIMEACGVPPEFATANLWTLEALAQGIERLPENMQSLRVEDLILQAFQALRDQPAEQVGDLASRVATLEESLAELLRSAASSPTPTAESNTAPAADGEKRPLREIVSGGTRQRPRRAQRQGR